ncbi:hypothetical protein [Sandaracinobacteroides saxicola]|uniref:Uncharacterized protein n=1 Tax=Sandaracinobacteroides saxicola TaxID=2759707 RepID=A0A7G5IHP6_9SPHN|nr:hypothetical protein [Sandaracinobacteroides saxicola]QMW22888.1 hypothetical protein H3309_16595 [Sandaracinobacteroides saxicola]
MTIDQPKSYSDAAKYNESVTSLNKLIFDKQLEYASLTDSAAKNYNNIIIVAGYAAFFALWSGVAGHMETQAKLWTVILMCVSLTSFIIWNVVLMIVQIEAVSLIGKAFKSVDNEEVFLKAWQSAQNERYKYSVLSQKWLWAPTFYVSLTTGLLAAVLLGYNALCEIVGVHGWPR